MSDGTCTFKMENVSKDYSISLWLNVFVTLNNCFTDNLNCILLFSFGLSSHIYMFICFPGLHRWCQGWWVNGLRQITCSGSGLVLTSVPKGNRPYRAIYCVCYTCLSGNIWWLCHLRFLYFICLNNSSQNRGVLTKQCASVISFCNWHFYYFI